MFDIAQTLARHFGDVKISAIILFGGVIWRKYENYNIEVGLPLSTLEYLTGENGSVKHWTYDVSFSFQTTNKKSTL
jgi:hypothetical protein